MQSLQLSEKTLSILKNFSSINNNILIREGNYLYTISETKNLFAKAKIDVEFESRFAIYDLSRFISLLSLFEEPTLEIEENQVTIRQNKKEAKYSFASEDVIVYPKKTEYVVENPVVKFDITKNQFSYLMKGLSILRQPELNIFSRNGKIMIRTNDRKNKGSDSISLEMGETDKDFNVNLLAENFKFLSKDYCVEVADTLVRFKSEEDNVEYIIAIEYED